MIGAGEEAGFSRTPRQLMAAVLANIIEGAQLAIETVGDNDSLFVDLGGEIAAGPGDLALVAGAPPALVEDRGLLGLVNGGVGVEARRQGEGLRGVGADGAFRLVAPEHLVIHVASFLQQWTHTLSSCKLPSSKE